MKEARFLPIDDVVCRWPLLRFEALAHKVESLDDAEAHATVMGRKIATLVSALEKVEQFEQVMSRVFFVMSCCVFHVCDGAEWQDERPAERRSSAARREPPATLPRDVDPAF